MEKEILEGNKMIAEFMGGKLLMNNIYNFPVSFGYKESYDEGGYIGSGKSSVWDIDEMEYHTSWDWLMPVVDKIESINECSYKVMLHYSIGFISDNSLHGNPIILRNTGFTRIETAYNLVVKFIEWYNSAKKP